MKKKMKMLVALLLAAVTVLALPLSAVAITYSGGYGGVNYVANISGSSSTIHTTLSVDTSSILYISTVAYFDSPTTHGHVDRYKGPKKNASYIADNYSYTSISGLPSGGYFTSCKYYDTMNSYVVINDIVLTF